MLVPSWPHLSADARETTHLVLESVRRLAGLIDSQAADESQLLPTAALAHAARMGLFGLSIPAACGGLGLGPPAFVRVMERLAAADLSVAVTLGAHQALAAQAIVRFGTAAQQQRYLPRIASGAAIAAFAMTEADSGSGVSFLRTQAVPQPDGSWLLRGGKTFITNGPLAEVFITFARCRDPQATQEEQPTAFLVERGWGVRSGPPMNKMGIRASNTSELFFDDVPVPADSVLGGLGNGFAVSQGSLAFSRLAVASGWTGVAKRIIELATAYAQNRRIGDQPIAEYAMIKELIGDMVVDTFAAESMVRLSAAVIESGFPDYGVESAVCKLYCTESACRVADRGISIGGGSGYVRDLPFERLLRDLRVGPIFEGTNEVIRLFVASRALQGPKRRLARLVDALAAGGAAPWRPAAGLEAHHRTWLALVEAADLAVAALRKRYPARVLEMQHAVRRMVAVWVDLYAMAACLSRASDARLVAVTSLLCRRAERRIRHNLELLDTAEDTDVERIASTVYEAARYPYDESAGVGR